MRVVARPAVDVALSSRERASMETNRDARLWPLCARLSPMIDFSDSLLLSRNQDVLQHSQSERDPSLPESE